MDKESSRVKFFSFFFPFSRINVGKKSIHQEPEEDQALEE